MGGGSTVLGIPPIPIPKDSTKAQHGRHLKSNWPTAEPWFSNPPDRQEAHLPKIRSQKESRQSGLESDGYGEWM
jgi:hypothetical protein